MTRTLSILLAVWLTSSAYASDAECEAEGFAKSQLFMLRSGAVIEKIGNKFIYQFDVPVDKKDPGLEARSIIFIGSELTFPAEDPYPGTNPVEDITLNIAMTYEDFKSNLGKLNPPLCEKEIITDEADPIIPELVEGNIKILSVSSSSESLEGAEAEETTHELEIGIEDYKAAIKSCHPCGALKYVGKFYTWLTTRAKQD